MLVPFSIELSNGLRLKSQGEFPLGSGRGCLVHPGVLIGKNGEKIPVAIKWTFLRSAKEMDRWETEAANLRALSWHSNVVSCYSKEVLTTGGGTYAMVVMERMDTDLHNLIFGNKTFRETWKYAVLLQIFVQMFTGLRFLHDANVVHYDLKPRNVLVSTNKTTGELAVKLADFGDSKFLREVEGSVSGTCRGSRMYMSPEVVKHAFAFHENTRFSHPKAADVYSAGMVMWECLNRSAVGVESTLQEIGRKIGWPDGVATRQIWCEAPPPLCDLIEDCLKREPGERPTSTQVLSRLEAMMNQHEWVHERVATFDEPLVHRVPSAPSSTSLEREPRKGCVGSYIRNMFQGCFSKTFLQRQQDSFTHIHLTRELSCYNPATSSPAPVAASGHHVEDPRFEEALDEAHNEVETVPPNSTPNPPHDILSEIESSLDDTCRAIGRSVSDSELKLRFERLGDPFDGKFGAGSLEGIDIKRTFIGDDSAEIQNTWGFNVSMGCQELLAAGAVVFCAVAIALFRFD